MSLCEMCLEGEEEMGLCAFFLYIEAFLLLLVHVILERLKCGSSWSLRIGISYIIHMVSGF